MAQTNQYGLKQWEDYEGLLRGDLNQAMAGVDQALAGAIAGVNQSVTAAAAQASQALAAETAARSNADAGLQGQVTALNTTKAELVIGSYVGDDAATREITLGFAPKAVLLEISIGARTTSGAIYGGLVLPDLPLGYANKGVALALTQTGFQVKYTNSPDLLHTNRSDYNYRYIAVK